MAKFFSYLYFTLVSFNFFVYSDILLNSIVNAKQKKTINSIVVVCSHSSPISGELFTKLHENETVPVIYYSDLWKTPVNYNLYVPSKIILEKFGSQLVVIAVLDENTTRRIILRNTLRLVERNQYINVILISKLKDPGTSMIAHGLFRSCLRFGLLNVFLLTTYSPEEVFTYIPFDGFRIVKTRNIINFSRHKIDNLNKFKFKIFQYGGPPRVILPQKGEGDLSLKGYVGNIIKSYIEKRNASVHYVNEITDSMSPYLDAIFLSVNRLIDFSLGLFPFGPFIWGHLSYPISMEENCVIAPVPKIIPAQQNFFLPFQKDVWIALICSIFYFTIILYVVHVMINRKKDIWHAFIIAVSLVIGIAEMGKIGRIQVRLIVFYLPLFLFGFILSNLYLALLTTFLTSPVYDREINTLADLYDAGLKIVLENVQKIHLTRQLNYAEYHPLLRGTHYSEFNHIKDTLNNSNALLLASDTWGFLDDIQRYRNDVRFRKSKICIYPFLLAVLFRFESPFVEDFNEHLLLIYQSGLLAYWKKHVFFEAMLAGYVNTTRARVREGPIQLSLVHMKLAFFVLILGLIISAGSFFVEWCLRRKLW